MEDKVRIGMIGAGAMANSVHYPSLSEFEDIEIAAICDLDDERLNRTADQYNVSGRYKEYRKMIEEADPDAVYIIMPPHHLFDLVIYALSQKRHVFIEKPPGITREQTKHMALAAERNGCLTMVAFNRRFIPLLVKAKEIIETQGPIIQTVATFYKNAIGAPPYYNGAIDILSCDAIHAVDTLRWMGGEVTTVASDIRSIDADYDNSFNALLKFQNGATGILLTNWMVGKRVHTFEMHARGISVFVDGNNRAVIYSGNRDEGQILDAREVAGSDQNYRFYGFYDENRHFIDCIKTGKLPQTHFGDAVKTMELVERIYQGQI